MIDVKHLSKSFGDHLVLDDLNEHIDVGEKVVVIGPSGSGKSTFLRCLNLLEEPTGGSIIFNGVDITKKKIKNYGRNLLCLTQYSVPFLQKQPPPSPLVSSLPAQQCL